MNAAVIKVAFANPPREGKKRASVKTDDGDFFLVFPEKLGLFQPGRTYRVEFSEKDYKGQTYKTITKCEPVEDKAPQSAGRSEGARADEFEFVTRVLSASIRACTVANTEQALIEATRMIRAVYRKAMA
jgi:hypothetical protein